MMNRIATHLRRLGAIALVGVLAFVLMSCDGFLDINEDPNAATRESVTNPGLVFIEAQTALASNKVMEIIGQSSIAQTWSAVNGTFIPAENYNQSTFTTGNTYLGNYTTTAGNLTEVIEIAEGADPDAVPYSPDNVIAQAELFRQYTYLYITSQFGPMAYSQANNFDEFPEPELDPQEEVLRGIIANADSALNRLDTDGARGIEDRDLFFEGDLSKWEKFGNSLKLRAYVLLLSGEGGNLGADGALGGTIRTELEALLEEPMIRSNADNALFPFSSGAGNENNFFQLSDDFGGGENLWFACSTTLVDEMSSLSDPRLSTYCQEDIDGGFTGVPQGETGTFIDSTEIGNVEESVISDNIHRPGYPEKFLTASEVQLKEAEVLFRLGETGAAYDKFVAGVESSLDFFDGRPGDIDGSAKTDYIENELPDEGSLTLQDIHLQQWIALFERNPETWTHWRRTKVPELTAPASASLESVQRRYQYPPDAVTANPNVSQQDPAAPMFFEGPDFFNGGN